MDRKNDIPDDIWEKIEHDFICGISAFDLEIKYGVKYGKILQRSRKFKWKKDKDAKLEINNEILVTENKSDIEKFDYSNSINILLDDDDEPVKNINKEYENLDLKESALLRAEKIISKCIEIYDKRFEKLLKVSEVEVLIQRGQFPNDGVFRVQAEAVQARMDSDVIKAGVSLIGVIFKFLELEEIKNNKRDTSIDKSFSNRYSDIFRKMNKKTKNNQLIN